MSLSRSTQKCSDSGVGAILIVGAQLRYPRLECCLGIAFLSIRPLLQRLYPRLEVPGGLLRPRFRSLELRIDPLAQGVNLPLELHLAISTCLRVLGLQLLELRLGSYRLAFPLIFLGGGPLFYVSDATK